MSHDRLMPVFTNRLSMRASLIVAVSLHAAILAALLTATDAGLPEPVMVPVEVRFELARPDAEQADEPRRDETRQDETRQAEVGQDETAPAGSAMADSIISETAIPDAPAPPPTPMQSVLEIAVADPLVVSETPPLPALRPQPPPMLKPIPARAAVVVRAAKQIARPASSRTTERAAGDLAAREPAPGAPRPALAGLSTPDQTMVSGAWQSALSGWVSAHRAYPDAARRLGQEGVVLLRFVVARNGHVMQTDIVRGSGHEPLDNAAMAMLHDAVVPPFPAEMAGDQTTVTVPIRYKLER